MTILSNPVTTRTLLDILHEHAEDPGLADTLDLEQPDRQWRRLPVGDEAELWLIGWPAGTGTGWHDHGEASGAFRTLRGTLTEHTWDGVLHARTLSAGTGRAFGSRHIHDVVNLSAKPAVSLHAYAPRLTTMSRYELVRGHLEVAGVERTGDTW